MINLIAFFLIFPMKRIQVKSMVIKYCNIFFNSRLKYQYWITMKFRVSYMWERTDTILWSDSSIRCPIFLSKFMVKALFLPSKCRHLSRAENCWGYAIIPIFEIFKKSFKGFPSSSKNRLFDRRYFLY